MNEEQKTQVALWRLGVLGPLVSAHLERGDRRMLFQEAASRTYEDHEGCRITLSSRTVEAWYYRWVKGGFEALKPRDRSDLGMCRSIPNEIAELILAITGESATIHTSDYPDAGAGGEGKGGRTYEKLGASFAEA